MVPVFVVVILAISLALAIIAVFIVNGVANSEQRELKTTIERRNEYVEEQRASLRANDKAWSNLAYLAPNLHKTLEGWNGDTHVYSTWDFALIKRLANARDQHEDYKLAKKIQEQH